MAATRRPVATIAIGAVTLAVSLVVLGAGAIDAAATAGGFIPLRLTEPGVLAPGAVPAWLTPFSAALLHGGWMHLIANMVMLAFLGARIEAVYGPGPTAFAYLAGAVLAAAGQWIAGPHSANAMVGASGAISAWFAIHAMLYGQIASPTRWKAVNRAINAAWLLAAWVALQFLTEGLFAAEGIMLATPAHIGGFVAGMLLQRPLLAWRYRNA